MVTFLQQCNMLFTIIMIHGNHLIDLYRFVLDKNPYVNISACALILVTPIKFAEKIHVLHVFHFCLLLRTLFCLFKIVCPPEGAPR